MWAPAQLENSEKEGCGLLISLFLNLGITIGSNIALLL
jgi:hypothetical protein